MTLYQYGSLHFTRRCNYTNHPRDVDPASRGRIEEERLEQAPGSDGRLPHPVAVDGLVTAVPDVVVPPSDSADYVLGQAEDIPPGLVGLGEAGDGGELSASLGLESYPGKAADLQRIADRLGCGRGLVGYPGHVVEVGHGLRPAHVKGLRDCPDNAVITLVSIRLKILEILVVDRNGPSATVQNG